MALKKSNALSIAQLVQEHREGNRAALPELMNRYKRDLLLYISVIAGTAFAEDLWQDTWVIVSTAILNGHYHEQGDFDAYIKDIAYHLASKFAPREKIFVHSLPIRHDDEAPDEPEYEFPDRSPGADEQLIKKEQEAAALNGFRHLNTLEKRIVLYVRMGKRFKEIGRIVGIANIGSLRTMYHRAVEKIKAYIL